MRIGFDLDGVLYPWHRLAFERVSREQGLSLSYEEFWRNSGQLPKEWFTASVQEAEMYARGEAVPEAVKTVQALHARGDEIFYISTSPASSLPVRRAWLARNGFPRPETLVITADKRTVVQELGVQVYLEDRVENILTLQDVTHLILVMHPWNEALWGQFPAIRGDDLPGALPLIEARRAALAPQGIA